VFGSNAGEEETISAGYEKEKKGFLRAQRTAREQRYPELVGFSMKVKHSTVTLDQVAL
jgi:hypothetical protein